MVVYAPSERSQTNSPIHISRSNSTMEDHYYYGMSGVGVAARPKNKLEVSFTRGNRIAW
jgi:hypothetical protein